MLGVGLGQIANMLTRLNSRNLQVDPQQCSRLRHKKSTCTRCVDHCPVDAITIQKTLQLDVEKCSGCGICGTVCPTGAFQAANPTNSELLKQVEERRQAPYLAFVCAKGASESDDRVVLVNCLGRLDESILVGAVSFGVSQVQLVDGVCEKCPNAVGHTVAAQTIVESNGLLQAYGIAPRVSFVSQFASASRDGIRSVPVVDNVSRRTFFSMLQRETKVAAALTLSGVLQPEKQNEAAIKRGELPQQLPFKRQLLLDGLRRLGEPMPGPFQNENGSWSSVQIRENCTGCQMCAFFCPTGALSRIEQDGKRGLSFRTLHCTACGLCADICYWKALDLSSQIDWAKAMEDTEQTFLPQAGVTLSPDEKAKRLMQSLSS